MLDLHHLINRSTCTLVFSIKNTMAINDSMSLGFTNSTEEHRAYDGERFTVGLLYLIVTISMLIPYSVCIYVIKKDKQMYDKAFRLFALNMGFGDIVQMVFIGLNSAITCLLPWDIPYMIRKLLASFSGLGWFTYVSLAQMMALNRFISIYWPVAAKRMFTRKTTIAMISLCWIHGLAWLCAYISPAVTIVYKLSENGIAYERDSGSAVGLLLNTIINWFHASSICICYGFIYYKVHQKRRQIKDAVISHEDKKERMVLLQSILLCSMDVAAAAGFWAIFQEIPLSRWTTFLATMSWLISAGGNSYLYLAVNSTIRKKFKKFIHFGKPENSNGNTSGQKIFTNGATTRRRATTTTATLS